MARDRAGATTRITSPERNRFGMIDEGTSRRLAISRRAGAAISRTRSCDAFASSIRSGACPAYEVTLHLSEMKSHHERAAVDDEDRAGHIILIHQRQVRLGRVGRLGDAIEWQGGAGVGIHLLPILLAHGRPQG